MILDRTVGSYRPSFKVFWVMTQGFPLSSIILNLVLDVMVHHWSSMVSEVGEFQEGWGREVHSIETLF